ncbi:MORN repeat-containing protein [Aureibaculum luteum]|uniref:hypothetical protein n=1 Tax=Aureibaculum luteum TaxID=1548456 RepID=UPI000E4680E7|nr:hypothetical protein [Aureibaculum luteum]
MKHLLSLLFFILFYGFSQFVNAQDCKVLVLKIDSIYTGKCKKGFAHGKGTAIGEDTYKGKFVKGWPSGKGTYTWANGDSYTGDFQEGKRFGEGKLTIKGIDRDSIMDGLWENDIYLGAKPKKPKVIIKEQIDRYTFRKIGDGKDRVLINFLQNGLPNKTLENLTINTSSGTETRLGNSTGYEFIDFPVTIRVSYSTMNKLNTMRHEALFEFKITEPGDWVLNLVN